MTSTRSSSEPDSELPPNSTEVLWNASARAILDAIPGEAFLVDSGFRLLAANRALLAAQRGGTLDPVGRLCHELMHGAKTPPNSCPLAQAASSGRPSESRIYDSTAQRWYETTVSPTVLRTGAGQPVFLHVLRDVTHQWTLGAQHVQSREHERAINDILRGLQGCHDSVAVLSFLLDSLTSLSWLGLTLSCAAYLVEQGRLRMVVHRNLDARLVARCRAVDVGSCLCGRAALGETVLSRHVDENHTHHYEGMQDHGHAIAPLMHEGNCLAVLNLYLRPGQALDAAQRTFLESVTAASAVALAARITEERERQARDRVVAFERLQAVGRLAGGVAHDFNNLMTVILSLTDFVHNELKPDDPTQKDIAGIRAAAMQAALLTRQLLAFSRKDATLPVALDLNCVLRDMEPALRTAAAPMVHVELDLAPDLRNVDIDPLQLDQLLTNLTANAREAMLAGGRLRIATANAILSERDTNLRMPVVPGHYVRLTVADEGVGIAPDAHAHLFEPFFTTKTFGKGTGMGLATVHGVVEQAGGNLSVESSPGEGSTFSVFLPVAAQERAAPTEPSCLAVAPTGGDVVLVADDDAQLRCVTARILRKSGYSVLEAACAPEALLQAQEARALSVLLTSVAVQGVPGKILAQQARHLFPDLRVLYMSNLQTEESDELAQLDTDSTILIKPFGEAVLLAKLREALVSD